MFDFNEEFVKEIRNTLGKVSKIKKISGIFH